MTLKKIVFVSALLYSLFPFNEANSMKTSKEIEEGEQTVTPYSRLSKIAALYIDTWNAPNMEVFGKIFSDKYEDEELKEKKDITYNISNFLSPLTVSYLKGIHIPFLEKFLKHEDIQQVNDFNIKQSLMFMSHDIKVTQESIITEERVKQMPSVISAVGKLYLVMNDQRKENGREVVGNGTGTFVKNKNETDFILSCAHFPHSMTQYDKNFIFEMFFFPYHLLDPKNNWPIGTEESRIPFEKYENLKVTGIHYPSDTLIQFLDKIEPTHVPSLSEKDIPYLRKVQEGKKDFACFLEKTPEKVAPMQFADFSPYSDSEIYYACGYPCWGMSDNTFIITEGKRGKAEANKVHFSFPAMHGMSGGPIFVWDNDLKNFFIVGILMGVDNTSLQTVGYPIKDADLEFLNEIK